MLNKIFDLLVDNRTKFEFVNVENKSQGAFTYDYRYNYRYKKIELQLEHSGNIDGGNDDLLTIKINDKNGGSHITFTPQYELLFNNDVVVDDTKKVYEPFYNKLKSILED